jgi:hypothetical protein
VKVFGGTVRASFIAIAATAVFMLSACSPAPALDPGPPKVPTCPAPNAQWAVGDSLGNETSRGVPGWPDSGTQKGQWANFSVPGAGAIRQTAFIEVNLGYCDDTQQPSLVVLEAGINDLAFGAQTATMLESTISNFVKSVSVPIRIVAITPMNANSPQLWVEPGREQYNTWLKATYPKLAIDCSSALAGGDGYLRPDYALSGDTLLHLNQAGEDALANCIGAAI